MFTGRFVLAKLLVKYIIAAIEGNRLNTTPSCSNSDTASDNERTSRQIKHLCLSLILLHASLSTVRGNIYEWEYVDPSDLSLGKQESNILTPGGAGLVAEPLLDVGAADLTKGYLSGANLSNAYFTWTILTDADLSGANLTNAYIRNTTLTNADLSGANLTNALFSNNYLTSGNVLANTNFTDAIITGANFGYGIDHGLIRSQIESTASFKNGVLLGVGLAYNNLSGWDFSNINLSGAGFYKATLSNTNFTNAVIDNASFAETTDKGFTRSQFESTASFKSGQLQGITLSYNDHSSWNLSYKDLENASITNTKLTNANLSGANLTSTTLFDTDMTYADLSGANLTDSFLWRTALANANLSGANLTNADFRDSTLSNADFTDAVIAGAIFRDTTDKGFTRRQFESTASFKSGQLQGIDLSYNDHTGWNLSYKDLKNAVIRNSKLTNANLSGANLTNVNFYLTDMTYADLSGANLTGANFYNTITNADFTDAVIAEASFTNRTDAGFTRNQFESTGSFKNGELQGIDLEKNDLTGWNFSNLNLTNATFRWADLANADFTDADITGANFKYTIKSGFTRSQIESTANFKNGQLLGIKLSGNNLTGWDFSNINLFDVEFEDANLTNADLSGANLTSANLFRTNLTNANLSGANLTDAYLRNPRLTNADFTDAIITGAYLWEITAKGFTRTQFESTASFKSGQLQGIKITSNDLSGWNFSNKNLTDTNFSGSNLTNADLSGADLRSANITIPDTAITRNTIHPDGHIAGLTVLANETFHVWDFNVPEEAINITINQSMELDSTSVFQFIFEDEAWGSTIEFEAGIKVALSGTLDLTFDKSADLAALDGSTFQLFDWTGVSPLGRFSNIRFDESTMWDISNLYTTGEVTFRAPEPSTLAMLLLVSAGGVLRRRV